MNFFELWLFTTAIPGIAFLGWLVFWICLLPLAVFLIVGAVNQKESEDYPKHSKKEKILSIKCYSISRKLFIAIVLSGLTGALLPGSREMLLIAGGYVSTNSQEIAKLPGSAAKAANAWLDAITKAAQKDQKIQ